MRDLRDPADTNRIRFRERAYDVQAEWIYTPAEMAIWKAWFEGTLESQVARLKYFNAPLPGRGGGRIERVARYMSPPKRVHISHGHWRITADLFVRGTSAVVQMASTVPGSTGGFELREDGSFELREDSTFELRG